MKELRIDSIECLTDVYNFDPDTGNRQTTAVFLLEEDASGEEYYLNAPCNDVACLLVAMIDACQAGEPPHPPIQRTVTKPLGGQESSEYRVEDGKLRIEVTRNGPFPRHWLGHFDCHSEMLKNLQIRLRSNAVCSCGP